MPQGQRILTALRCHRPGRRPCPGRLRVLIQDDEAPLHWECSSCRLAGTIEAWACSDFDLGGPEAVEQAVRGARTVRDGVLLVASEATMEALEVEVAYASDHADSPAMRRRLEAAAVELADAEPMEVP